MSRNSIKRPLIEQIEELKVKIDLLDGDRKAYYESSFFVMQQNRESIAELRKETYELRRNLRDTLHADDHVISQAFQNRPVEKAAFSHKTSVVAIEQMDYKVSDTMKRFNYVKSVTEQKRKKLEELKQQQADLEEIDGLVNHPKDTRYAQSLRDMENRLDKLKLKCNEAEYIHKTYEHIHGRLMEEHTRCNHVLNDMEADIRRCSKEKEELVTMHKDAVSNQESTIDELRRHEEYIYADKKRREIEITRMRKVAEDKKLENERVEKKTVDEVMSDTRDDSCDENTDRKEEPDGDSELLIYEERFKKLKDATGTPDLNGILLKFESQMEIKQKLITVINEMEDTITTLRKERDKLQENLKDVKSIGEAKSLVANKDLAKRTTALTEKATTASSTASEYEDISKFIVQAKAGLEHMMEKLFHLRNRDRAQSKIVTAEDYVIDIIKKIEGSFNRMLTDLSTFDLDDFKSKMTFEEQVLVQPISEFQTNVKKKVPTNNSRVKNLSSRLADDDDDSGDDLPEWKSRLQMKQASEEYIQLKRKKKQQQRRKKKVK